VREKDKSLPEGAINRPRAALPRTKLPNKKRRKGGRGKKKNLPDVFKTRGAGKIEAVCSNKELTAIKG